MDLETSISFTRFKVLLPLPSGVDFYIKVHFPCSSANTQLCIKKAISPPKYSIIHGGLCALTLQ